MRTSDDLRGSLSPELLQAFEEQLATLKQYVHGLSEDEALERLDGAMRQLFVQSYGLPADSAAALSRLAREQPVSERCPTRVLAVAERHALQRALIVVGLGRDVQPYFAAAGRGAREGFALGEESVLWLDPSRPVARIPTVPRLHSQDATLHGATVARSIFTEGLE
ncbi:MAG TPA: hypothetical protein VF178_15525 [Gemmatimonadaceae bacterium]